MSFQSASYVPVDYIKCELKGIEKSLLFNNKLLDFKSVLNRRTGEISENMVAHFKNIKIIIFGSGRIWFSGSLHMFYNDGKHNHNDFNKSAFQSILNELKISLGIYPENMRILNLEWGFNIIPPCQTNYILDRVIQHKSVNKTVKIDCPIDGKYIQFKHSNYILKLYNKGQHFKLNKELFRIEIKQTNWSSYRTKGIETLQQFIDVDKTFFVNEILKKWQMVVFYDINNLITYSYVIFSSQIFWSDLRKNSYRKKFKDNFDKLKELNKSIGFDNQDKISALIKAKSNELQV